MNKYCVLCVLTFLAMSLPLFAEQKQLVKIDGSSNIVLPAGGDREVRLAVTVSEGQTLAATEDPLVVEAAFNGVRSTELQQKFTAKWDEGMAKTPVALIISVKKEIVQPGKYSLVLLPQPTHPEVARLSIELEQPAGDLDLPAKMIVRRTEYLPFGRK